MRVVLISDWFAERMGYAENCLPKAMAALGHDVHLIAGNVQPYFSSPSYRETYEPFIGPATVPCETKPRDGYMLYRLPHRVFGRRRRLHLDGLVPLLRSLRPDVVQTFEVAALSTYEAALAKGLVGYQLFLETHLHASAFGGIPSWQRPAVFGAGRFASLMSKHCWAISSDAAEIGIEGLGVEPRKMSICSLGVDTQLFRPPNAAERASARSRFGFADHEVVCVYSGRFSNDKGPHLLADAIDMLVRKGLPYRGLFIGSGTPSEVDAITSRRGCIHHGFVPVVDLPQLYWAGDIGVWPKQESTSQLDAASVGMPLVLSEKVHVRERVDGNGATYREGDAEHLSRVLADLANQGVRARLAQHGVKKMTEQYSWTRIARERVAAYEVAR